MAGFASVGGRIVTVALAAWLGALLAASGAEAQARSSPPPSPEQMQQQIDLMGPAMAKMMENMYRGGCYARWPSPRAPSSWRPS